MIKNQNDGKTKEDLLRDMKPSGSYLGNLASFSDVLGTIKQAENAAKELLNETSEAKQTKKPRFNNDDNNSGVHNIQVTDGTAQNSKDVSNEQVSQSNNSDAGTQPKEEKPTLDELLAKLDELVGLESIKQSVRSIINYVKVRNLRSDNNLPNPALSLHMVFTGNPGTGKTTVARILSEIYCSIGVLSKGQLVEVDRSGLVAGFVGQTAIKTSEVVTSALGGILFIDEAYALAPELTSSGDFGREAIETLLKLMEDNRNDLIVIVAGYSEPMERFISANPGLESRFNRYFEFEDYDSEELDEIFLSMCNKSQYALTQEAKEFAKTHFKIIYDNRDENFGNARHVRNFFENIVAQHSDRISVMQEHTRDDLITVELADLENAVTFDKSDFKIVL